MNSKWLVLVIVAISGLITLRSRADGSATGILRVEGQPGNLQPSSVFLQKCDVDTNGTLVKYTCGKQGDYGRLSEGRLNTDIQLREGTYAMSYDHAGSENLIKIKGGIL